MKLITYDEWFLFLKNKKIDYLKKLKSEFSYLDNSREFNGFINNFINNVIDNVNSQNNNIFDLSNISYLCFLFLDKYIVEQFNHIIYSYYDTDYQLDIDINDSEDSDDSVKINKHSGIIPIDKEIIQFINLIISKIPTPR